jgi:hypothetical protein
VLTADLVDVRRNGNAIELAPLDAKKLARAEEIAAQVLACISAHAGRTRAELEASLASIEVGMREQRLKDALIKLATDATEWHEADPQAAEDLRRDVFVRAATMRREGRFDRAALLEAIASERGTTVDVLENELFGDLREAHRIARAPAIDAPSLVSTWERSRAQAVLLRATRVSVMLRCGDAHRARDLFRAIKFLGLIYTLTKQREGYLLEVDGPFSLFESITKYGLKLALLVPVLDACEAYALEASIRWGKEKSPYVFRLSGGRGADVSIAPDETVSDVARALANLGWDATPNVEIFDLPGVGLCIPDLVLAKGTGRVFVEILGFWSRAAVWKRVELVEKGLAPPIVFAVSARLRVSEDVLPEDAPSALYVYKGAISARALSAKAEALLPRSS